MARIMRVPIGKFKTVRRFSLSVPNNDVRISHIHECI